MRCDFMQLISLLGGFIYFLLKGSLYTEITGICDDSGRICPGEVFVCIRGNHTDGHKMIGEALRLGASAIVAEYPIEMDEKYGVTLIQTPDTRLAKALMAAAFYDHPDRKLKIIGITGTKGKTTTAYMLKSILEAEGFKTGIIGTIEIFDGENSVKTKNTTPDALTIYEALARMAENKVSHAVMEVSSQGLKQSRTAGLYFTVGMMTNISKDHIGKYEHKDMEEYMFYKSLLFRQCSIGFVNASDMLSGKALTHYGGRLAGCLYGGKKAWLPKKKILYRGYQKADGLQFLERDGQSFFASVSMPGEFNRENAFMAASAAAWLGISPASIKAGLRCASVKGRMEIIPANCKATVMIDYAHNADALERLLKAVRGFCGGRIICMFGCGGNRSGERRFLMGNVSASLADLTVITSDNPRDEPPGDIILEIAKGAVAAGGCYKIIEDRLQAIDYCIEAADAGDIVILAGKGHEDYQEIKGKRYPMDERAYVMKKYERIP